MKKFFALLVVFFALSPAFGGDYFALGKKAFANQDYQTAETLFLKALSTSQNNWACRYFLATAYVNQNEIAKAKQEYSKIITYAPNSKEAELSWESLVNLNKTAAVSAPPKYLNGGNYLEFAKYDGRYVRWEKLPISVYVQPSDYELLVKQAFLTWQKALNDLIKFNFTKDVSGADLGVYMTDKLSSFEEGPEAGSAKIFVRGDFIKKSDIHLLCKDSKTGGALSDNIIFSTALHEIGHSLGIQGHSPDENDIMSAKNTVGLKSLTKRDLNTIKMLYKDF